MWFFAVRSLPSYVRLSTLQRLYLVFLADYSVNKDKILGVKVCTDGCL